VQKSCLLAKDVRLVLAILPTVAVFESFPFEATQIIKQLFSPELIPVANENEVSDVTSVLVAEVPIGEPVGTQPEYATVPAQQ
jgi:hypothetical protein